jgi:hypothetical protein
MTESEWLECTDPTPMLEFLRGKVSDRQWRLFTCACCRRIWHLLANEQGQQLVIAAERSADDPPSNRVNVIGGNIIDAIDYARHTQGQRLHLISFYLAPEARRGHLYTTEAEVVAQEVLRIISQEPTDQQSDEEKTGQTHFLRDILGNPFRPIRLDPAWLTASVKALAQSIYDDRQFTGLPVLADALEDAGCINADILNHCRQAAGHVQGCWVVDSILGKK